MFRSGFILTLFISFFLQKSESINDLIQFELNSLKEVNHNLDSLLQELKTNNGIHILHIGDSHVQIGELSNGIKQGLKENNCPIENNWFIPSGIFSNLYHPYLNIVAQSNPFKTFDIRNDSVKENLGITGRTFSLVSGHNDVRFKSNIPTNQIDFLHSVDSNIVFKTKHKITQHTIKLSANYAITTLKFHKPTLKFKIDFINNSDKQIDFYAMRINHNKESNSYSKFGVSGAKFSDFFEAKELHHQLEVLKPNIILVTLGTNDSYYNSLDTNKFENKLKEFILSLKKVNPKIEFIFMTSPDTKYKGSKPKFNQYINNTIKSVCKERNIAYWDWYEVMGGENAIDKWENAGFSSGDYLHFSSIGYQAFGKYFANALVKQKEN